MKLCALAVALAAVSSPLLAQGDACRGAVSVLSRVKEEITPDLSKSDPAGRETLGKMQVSLEQATHVCQTVPELWYYRALVESRLGMRANIKVQQSAAGFKTDFDPFTPPPSAKPPADNGPVIVRRKWALVVGINQFKDPNVNTLRFAAKDAADFAAYLQDPKGGRFQSGRVRLLQDDQATLQNIREGIGWLRDSVQQDDLVVLYFASHGSPRAADPNGMSYIITHDTDISNPAKLYATSLQMIDLVQQLNRDLKVKRVILFLDTCFSGDAAGARGVLAFAPASAPPQEVVSSGTVFSGALRVLSTGSGRAVITASRADQFSQESEALKNGYFTSCLLNSFRDGGVEWPLAKVFQDVRDRVMKAVKNQTPSSQFSGSADSFVLGVPEAEASSAQTGH